MSSKAIGSLRALEKLLHLLNIRKAGKITEEGFNQQYKELLERYDQWLTGNRRS